MPTDAVVSSHSSQSRAASTGPHRPANVQPSLVARVPSGQHGQDDSVVSQCTDPNVQPPAAVASIPSQHSVDHVTRQSEGNGGDQRASGLQPAPMNVDMSLFDLHYLEQLEAQVSIPFCLFHDDPILTVCFIEAYLLIPPCPIYVDSSFRKQGVIFTQPTAGSFRAAHER